MQLDDTWLLCCGYSCWIKIFDIYRTMIVDNIVSWGLKQKASLTKSSQCDETTLVETNHKPATVIFQLKQQPSSWSADVRQLIPPCIIHCQEVKSLDWLLQTWLSPLLHRYIVLWDTGLIISYYYVGETGYRDNKES